VQAGWESGDGQQVGAGSVGSFGGAMPAAVASVPAPRSGAYCLKCAATINSTSTGWTQWASRLTIAHATVTEIWIAFGFQYSHFVEPGTQNWVFCHVLDPAGNVNLVLCCDAGTIRAYAVTAGTTQPTPANATLIGTASSAISAGAWHLVEVRLIASTTTGGTCQVYADGTQVINATGVRTAQTTASYQSVVLSVNNWSGNASTGTSYHSFDDFRCNSVAGSVNNGRPGDESIRLIVPNAPGDLTQLTRGGTDSGNNWDQCDEVPASTAEYVTGAGAGLTDLYHTTDLAPTSVSAVNVLALASNASGGGTVALVTRTPAGQSAGTAVSLQTTWGWTSRLLEVDPADSAAWSSSKLAALQIGAAVG